MWLCDCWLVSELAVRVTPDSQFVQLGGTATFRCVATGQQPLNITWTLADDSPLPDGVTVNDDGSLVVDPVTGGAVYKCTARSGGDVASDTGALRTGGKKQHGDSCVISIC